MTPGALLSAAFISASGFSSCTEPSINKYSVGDCLRNKEEMGLDRRIGTFRFVVDKTNKSYVLCYGRYGKKESVLANSWYGCGIVYSVDFINNEYEKVICPRWTVDDDESPYYGIESK